MYLTRVIMSRGNKASIRAKGDGKGDTDKYFIKNVKYYCKGRGCRHRGMPDFKPTAVCFYIKGSGCSHREIMERIEDLLPMHPGAKVLSVQYIPLAVHLDRLETDNRWVITLNSMEARNRLAGTSMHIRGQKVTLRRYDDIIQLEYRKCARSTELLSMVNKIKKLETDLSDIHVAGASRDVHTKLHQGSMRLDGC